MQKHIKRQWDSFSLSFRCCAAILLLLFCAQFSVCAGYTIICGCTAVCTIKTYFLQFALCVCVCVSLCMCGVAHYKNVKNTIRFSAKFALLWHLMWENNITVCAHIKSMLHRHTWHIAWIAKSIFSHIINCYGLNHMHSGLIDLER